MSHPRRPDGSVLPAAAGCDAHCCHPVKPASINGDAKAPDGVGIHQRRGNANGRVMTKEEDEYCRFKFNSAEGDDLYLVFAEATALAQANAQEKFLRIKHAYNTLMNSESRSKYGSSSSSSPDSSWLMRKRISMGLGISLKYCKQNFRTGRLA